MHKFIGNIHIDFRDKEEVCLEFTSWNYSRLETFLEVTTHLLIGPKTYIYNCDSIEAIEVELYP